MGVPGCPAVVSPPHLNSLFSKGPLSGHTLGSSAPLGWGGLNGLPWAFTIVTVSPSLLCWMHEGHKVVHGLSEGGVQRTTGGSTLHSERPEALQGPAQGQLSALGWAGHGPAALSWPGWAGCCLVLG